MPDRGTGGVRLRRGRRPGRRSSSEHPDEALRPKVDNAVQYCPAMALSVRGGVSVRRGDGGVLGAVAGRQPGRRGRAATGASSRTSTPRTRRTAGCTRPTSTSWRSAARRSAKYAVGTEMAGLDGWHYDYAATVMDESNGMIVGFWKQRAGIDGRLDRPGVRDPGDRRLVVRLVAGRVRLAARLVRPRQHRDDVPRDRRQREGAAGPAGPDVAERHGAARSLPARRPALDRLAAGGGRPMRVTDAIPAPRMLVDGKLVDAAERSDVPDPEPGHRPGDRAGAGRQRRRHGRRDRCRAPGVRRDRLVDEPRAAACAACASCTRRWSTTATRCAR